MKIEKEILRIIKDKTSGSMDILFKINNLIRKNIDDTELIIQLLNSRKKNLLSFGAIIKYLKKINAVKNNRTKLIEFISEIERQYQNKYQKLYLNASDTLQNISIFLTISNSRTIYEIIKLHFKEKQNIKAVVCESRPNYEGKILAKKFLRLGIKTELITDAMLAEKIPQVDAVIIGADTVTSSGDVYNKIGSNAAAIIANYFTIPFYVFVTREKFSKANRFKNKYGDALEIWKFSNPDLKLDNRYFEKIDKKLITKIFTD